MKRRQYLCQGPAVVPKYHADLQWDNSHAEFACSKRLPFPCQAEISQKPGALRCILVPFLVVTGTVIADA